MAAEPPPPKAGWYPDPDQAETQRYWDGNQWTEQRAPSQSSGASTNQLPLGLALLGAGIAAIGTFLPQVEAPGLTEVKDNSLIQSGDGVIVLIMALVGAIAAYTGRDGPRRRAWIALLAGLVIVAFAIHDGTGDRLHLTGTATDSSDLTEALDAIAGEQGTAGIGIWATGVGGTLLALGGLWLRGEVPRKTRG